MRLRKELLRLFELFKAGLALCQVYARWQRNCSMPPSASREVYHGGWAMSTLRVASPPGTSGHTPASSYDPFAQPRDGSFFDNSRATVRYSRQHYSDTRFLRSFTPEAVTYSSASTISHYIRSIIRVPCKGQLAMSAQRGRRLRALHWS